MAKINEALNKYLQLCAKFAPIDINVAHREILAAIKHHDKIKFDTKYSGYDISKTYINIAKEKFPNEKFYLLDIANEKSQNSDK